MSRTAIMLALIATLLTGLVALELTSPGANLDEALNSTASGPGPGMARDTGGGAQQTVAAILSRPLFRGDRRPAPADAQNVASGQSGDIPRLTGILMSSDGRRAIFQPAGKERAIVVVIGETVGNWRVQDIAVDAVTLTGPGGTRRLEPKFAASGSSNAPFQQPSPGPGINRAGTGGPGISGTGTNGPLFGGVGAQQNGGMDRPQGKH